MIVVAMALAGTSMSAGQMTASWRWEADRIVLSIAAPTTGWVAVGLNDREALANSRLVMVQAWPPGSCSASVTVRHPEVA